MLVFTSAVPDVVKEFEPLRLSDCGGWGGYGSQIPKATSHNHTSCYVTFE